MKPKKEKPIAREPLRVLAAQLEQGLDNLGGLNVADVEILNARLELLTKIKNILTPPPKASFRDKPIAGVIIASGLTLLGTNLSSYQAAFERRMQLEIQHKERADALDRTALEAQREELRVIADVMTRSNGDDYPTKLLLLHRLGSIKLSPEAIAILEQRLKDQQKTPP
jgi:hypothetical protein